MAHTILFSLDSCRVALRLKSSISTFDPMYLLLSMIHSRQ